MFEHIEKLELEAVQYATTNHQIHMAKMFAQLLRELVEIREAINYLGIAQ